MSHAEQYSMSNIHIEYPHGSSDNLVVVEEMNGCCYAYFLQSNQIVGDVWLYNVGAAPDTPPWEQPDAQERMPFRNPIAFCVDETFDTHLSEKDFEVVFGNAQPPALAHIFIRHQLHAVVGVGLRPGYCRLALGDGPLARPLIPR
jgi:hypothetical protein